MSKQRGTDKPNFSDNLNTLKNMSISSHLIVSNFIDAMDSNNSWRIGRILRKTNDSVKISYHGWSRSWDEVSPFKTKQKKSVEN
jgi:hypothetical protein